MTQRITHVPCGPFANESERRALDYLRQRLIGDEASGTWVLLTNLSLSLQSSARMPHEIDLLAIGPPGLSVIEVKHWDRRFLETSSNSDVLRTEALKAQRKAQLLKSRLKKHDAVRALFIPARMLFTGAERERYSGATNIAALSGIPAYSLGEWQELLDYKASPLIDTGQIAAILQSLDEAIPRVAKPRMTAFADYRECQLIGDGEFHWRRTYRATKTTSKDRVVLHIYDLSASSEPDTLNVARREFEALRRLQKLDCIPPLMDSFQALPDFAGEMYYFSYNEPAATPIETKSSDTSWDFNDRLHFAQTCFDQLATIHGINEDAVLHRRLSPSTVLVKSNNSPIFLGFEFARLPGADTVAGAAPRPDPDRHWLAPEVRAAGLDLATTASDVYALCAVLSSILAGIDSEEAEDARQILQSGLVDNPHERPVCSQVAHRLAELLQGLSQRDSTSSRRQEPGPDHWDEVTVKELNGRRYRIVQPLGKGSFGFTFKVEEISNIGEPISGPYVAKAIVCTENGLSACRAYSLVRAQTGSSTLAGVLEVATEWQPNQITALMKWIDGDSLDTFMGVLPLLFEDNDISSLEDGLRQWLLDLLEGLLVLHKAGLVHGDVSARNIIVNGASVVLTDYDLARREGELAGGGTPIYSAPEIDRREPLLRSADVYALASTIFHVAFEASPFQHPNGLDKLRGLNWPDGSRERIPSLVTFFDRATDPDPSQRFPTADEAIAHLRKSPTVAGLDTTDVSDATPTRSAGEFYEAEVPWLKQVLQMHPASPYGNPETRGLDSPFARQTYVETNLDFKLASDIRDGRVKLVFLCGNAGDGKTAFLQNLADNLGASGDSSATRVWSFATDNGIKIKINLDGAASFEGKSANDLLTTFLEPFRDGVPSDGAVHLVAINDGPLLAWVEGQEDSWLTQQIQALLDEENAATVDARVLFIDLNKRSLVGTVHDGAADESDFLEKLIDRMLGTSDTWLACSSCVAQSYCPAWKAVQDLQAPDDGPYMRKQLARLLQAVHQRGEVHITARLLRSALSFGFFGTEYCADIHSAPEKKRAYYWDRIFSPRIQFRQGELLEELVRMDPALESQPQVDRTLMNESPIHFENEMKPEELLATRRRRAFFNRSSLNAIDKVDDPHALDTGILRRLIDFQALVDPTAAEEYCRKICDGISRMQDLPDEAFGQADSMPILVTPRTPTETVFWVLKPRSRFGLEPAQGNSVDFPFLHTQAILKYTFENGHEERLCMGLTLFSLLLDIHEGYQLTSSLSDDLFANLSIFSQRLAQEDQGTLFAWNPSGSDVLRIATQIVNDQHTVQQLVLERQGQETQ